MARPVLARRNLRSSTSTGCLRFTLLTTRGTGLGWPERSSAVPFYGIAFPPTLLWATLELGFAAWLLLAVVRNIKLGLTLLRNIFWKVGVLGDYKREFWKFALRRLARGEIEYLIGSILVAHHLILFARDASVGQQNASNYSMRLREASVPAE